ncbi:MAG: hypothetical protein ACM31O_21010 [Bacteroidota bacterium]
MIGNNLQVTRTMDASPGIALYTYSAKDNLIVGGRSILRYVKRINNQMLQEWIEEYGFPVTRLPNDTLVTTMRAIDDWIFLVAEASAGKHEARRGAYAKKRIERRRRKQRAAFAYNASRRSRLY